MALVTPTTRFNPRPSSLTGDPHQGGVGVGGHWGFNPRPSSLTGDPRQHRHARGTCAGFNPRPSSLTGDPPGVEQIGPHLLVSIRARHR